MSETVFHRSLQADNKAADLGYGVLDTAMVETAAYCLVKCE